MPANLPSGTVTFLFTDIEGSTRLWEQFPAAMKAALARHDEILGLAVAGSGGRIIKNTGDGIHAVFDTALEGLRAALTAQQMLCREPWAEIAPRRIRVRMGLHTGEAQERAGDYYGPALNRGARLMSVAHGGQSLLSTTTAGLVRDQLPEQASLRDLGEHRLKDLVRSEHLFQLVHPGIDTEFPPIRSVDVFPNNLPVQLTSFIGREREIREAGERLASARLLTLIGPGGTGKTRLSLQLAADLLPSFPDGVWLVELAPITDPALITQSIAGVFRLREQLGMPLNELVIDYLRDKELLLILDNCEHLVEACAQIVDQLLHVSTRLKVIASSREALGIPGETIYRVPPLSLPDQVSQQALERAEAVQLFVERARAARPRLTLTAQNAEPIAQICRRLDGIPLALELAAARVTAFSPEQIASHLDDRFRLLTGGSRTALPRQQTLRALIDWSYDLLSEPERTLLCKLSVFSGGWSFEAAEAVCPELDVLGLLPQLVNKSLVTVDEEAVEPRYWLLETVRQYARDKLLEMGQTEAARNAHFDYFHGLAATAAPRLSDFGASEWVERLDREHGNLRAAMQWGLENRLEDLLQMIPLLAYFWNRRGYEEEARALIRDALQRSAQTPEFQGDAEPHRLKLVGKAWQTLAMLAYSQGDNIRAVAASAQAAQFARRLGDQELLALALGFEASGALFLGQMEHMDAILKEGLQAANASHDKIAMGLPLSLMAQAIAATTGNARMAKEHLERGQKLIRESGDKWGGAMALLGSAMVAKFSGDYAEARRQFLAIEPLFRDLGDQHRINMVRSELAHLERYQAHYAQAEAMYRESIQEWRRIGHRAAVAHQLESFAYIAIRTEQPERAAQLFGAAEALRERIGIPMTMVEKKEYENAVSQLRQGMLETDFLSAWERGRSLTLDQAVRYAIEIAP